MSEAAIQGYNRDKKILTAALALLPQDKHGVWITRSSIEDRLKIIDENILRIVRATAKA